MSVTLVMRLNLGCITKIILSILNALYDGSSLKEIDTSSGITSHNMVKIYEIISTRLNRELSNAHKFETFIFYFNLKHVLINLNVEQTESPMVFEVINDRGVKLKPYEILRGKLGQIDKLELDKFKLNDMWEKQVNRIYTRAEGTWFDNNYHREMFEDDIDAILS